MRSFPIAAVTAALLTACGGGKGTFNVEDAGRDGGDEGAGGGWGGAWGGDRGGGEGGGGGGGGGGGPVDAPDAPAPPQLVDWECAPGWLQEVVGVDRPWAMRVCAPPPPVRCIRATVQQVGQAACARVGTACPPEGQARAEAELRLLAPGFDGPIVHVRPDAAEGGDGSAGAPLRSVEGAVAAAPAGAVVALSPGEHLGPVTLHQRVALVGACAEGTVLQPAPGAAKPVLVTVLADGARITNLTLTGDRPGIGVVDAADASISSVVVDSTTEMGIFVLGVSSATITDSVVRSVITRLDDGKPIAVALAAGAGARVTIKRTTLEGGVNGLVVGGEGPPSTAEVEDLAIREVGRHVEEGAPVGLLVGTGGTVNGERLLLEGLAATAVLVESKVPEGPAVASLKDLVIRDHDEPPSGFWTFGAFVSGIAKLTLSRAFLQEVWGHGLTVAGPREGDSPELVVEDTVVAGSQVTPLPAGGVGLLAMDRARVTARRVVFDGNRRAAVGAYLIDERGDAPEVLMEDVVVRGPATADPEREGAGVEAGQGASVTLRRALIEDVHLAGVGVGVGQPDRPTVVDASDVTVRGLTADVLGRAGAGVVVEGGTAVTLDRVAVQDVEGVGVVALRIDDLPPATLTVTHLSIEGSTAPARCEGITDDAGRCVDGAGGYQMPGVALALIGEIEVDVSDFSLTGAEHAGMLFWGGALLRARRGSVSANVFGLRVDSDEDEWDPDFEEVFVYDNQTDFARAEPQPPNLEAVFRRPDLTGGLLPTP